ncbi:MAG: hypothetical protein ACK56I_03895 [bacterium]
MQSWSGIKNLTWYGSPCFQAQNVFTLLHEVTYPFLEFQPDSPAAP